MVTPEGIAKVLQHIPFLEQSSEAKYEYRKDFSLFDPYLYSEKTVELLSNLSEAGLVQSFDWPSWRENAERYIENPELVQHADLETLQKLITTHLRAERFISGHIAQMIDNGHLLAILQRLSTLSPIISGIPKELMQRIRVMKGDITRQEVDAIVNAANESLLGGGGVDGAIHRAAGPKLTEECRYLGGCSTGQAKITRGYRLPSPRVIHTVGPVWQGGQSNEAEYLASCYSECLNLAKEKCIQSIAFPAISTGAYGFPLEQATAVALREVSMFLAVNSTPAEVTFVCFDDDVYNCYESAISEW